MSGTLGLTLLWIGFGAGYWLLENERGGGETGRAVTVLGLIVLVGQLLAVVFA